MVRRRRGGEARRRACRSVARGDGGVLLGVWWLRWRTGSSGVTTKSLYRALTLRAQHTRRRGIVVRWNIHSKVRVGSAIFPGGVAARRGRTACDSRRGAAWGRPPEHNAQAAVRCYRPEADLKVLVGDAWARRARAQRDDRSRVVGTVCADRLASSQKWAHHWEGSASPALRA